LFADRRSKDKSGRIDASENSLVEDDRFGYWLNGAKVIERKRSKLGEFIIRYLVGMLALVTVGAFRWKRKRAA
jgi:hypothetical protein